MDRFPYDAEAREQQLITETRKQFSILSRAVDAGDGQALKRIGDALGEYVSDTQAAGELVRDMLTNRDAGQKVITDLIWAEAGTLAEIEVKCMERRRKESADEDRIERYQWRREYEHCQV